MRKRVSIFLSLILFEWHMFAGNPQHTNYSPVEFSSGLSPIWVFDLGKHIYTHTRRASVWSSSAVAAKIDGDFFVFIGAYNHNLYCINLKDGREAWRFTTAGPINSSPLFLWIEDKPMVIVASSDRVIYCLDARTGKKLWNSEIYPWTFTVFGAITTSPVTVEFDGSLRVVIGIWCADRRPFRNKQESKIICFDALTGKKIWVKEISQSHIFSPAFAEIKDKPLIFVTSFDGNLYCLSAKTGEIFWKFTTSNPITSAPLVTKIKDKDAVIFGTFFGLLFCVDAQNGNIFWKYKTGAQISSTGAASTIDERQVLFVPNFDRRIYALDIASGNCLWKYMTRQHVVSSPIIAKIKGNEALIFASLDNNLYILDAKNGKLIFNQELGSRFWLYETRGETLWPSPIAISYNNKPFLLVPWYNGKIYAFTAGD